VVLQEPLPLREEFALYTLVSRGPLTLAHFSIFEFFPSLLERLDFDLLLTDAGFAHKLSNHDVRHLHEPGILFNFIVDFVVFVHQCNLVQLLVHRPVLHVDLVVCALTEGGQLGNGFGADSDDDGVLTAPVVRHIGTILDFVVDAE